MQRLCAVFVKLPNFSLLAVRKVGRNIEVRVNRFFQGHGHMFTTPERRTVSADDNLYKPG